MIRSSASLRSRGFTLVELLVVIAIIGVLVALLLPAVQAARESARRSQCTNHLKQLGLACQLHVDSFKALPSAGWGDWWVGCPDMGYGEKQPGNWTYQLLPFIEESARRKVGQGFTCGDPNSRAAIGQMVATPVTTFYCPSRRPAQGFPWTNQGSYNFNPPPLAAKTDYAASVGDVNFFDSDIGPTTLQQANTYIWKHSGPNFVNKAKALGSQSPTGHSGVIFQRSETTLQQITDGTTYTYLLGEKNMNSDRYEDCLTGNDDQSMYNGHDRDNLRSTFLWQKGFEGKTSPKWIPQPDTPGGYYEWSFGGPHAGGWIALFCDGSVRFLPFAMEPVVHQRFGNRLDGESVDASGL